MARTGRPQKLMENPAITAVVVDGIERGLYLETAAALAGIDKSTLWRWLKRGARDKSGAYHEFCNAVKGAMARAESNLLDILQTAATRKKSPDWTAAAWILERRHPEKWGRKRFQTVNFQGELVEPKPGDVDTDAPEELTDRALEAEIRKLLGHVGD